MVNKLNVPHMSSEIGVEIGVKWVLGQCIITAGYERVDG